MPHTVYFDAAHAIQIHDWIIQHSQGRAGMLNLDNLESPLAHIQTDDYYPELHDKLTHLVFTINKNHPFNDGNKRSSIALGAYFLLLNCYGSVIERFILEMENIAVAVADNQIDKALLGEIIQSIMYDADYSEALKLKRIHALSNNRAN